MIGYANEVIITDCVNIGDISIGIKDGNSIPFCVKSIVSICAEPKISNVYYSCSATYDVPQNVGEYKNANIVNKTLEEIKTVISSKTHSNLIL